MQIGVNTMTNGTLGFYNKHAVEYAADEGGPNPRLFGFLDRCRPAGKVLELGTGGGVDAETIIARGFDLDATDGSDQLAAIASRRIGRTVRTMLFDELEALERYDGVYACASLTHVPRDALPGVVSRVYRSLTRGGVVWASFKAGAAEGDDDLGRHYNYMARDELIGVWERAARWSEITTETWLGSGYDRRATRWVSVTATK
jgi:hypothetical protein